MLHGYGIVVLIKGIAVLFSVMFTARYNLWFAMTTFTVLVTFVAEMAKHAVELELNENEDESAV